MDYYYKYIKYKFKYLTSKNFQLGGTKKLKKSKTNGTKKEQKNGNVMKYINKILDLLRENYIYPNELESLEKHINEKIDEYKGKTKLAIIKMLNDDIQLVLKDKHIMIRQNKLKKKTKEKTNNKEKDYIKFLQTEWLTSKIMNHEIGYIQFNHFPAITEDYQKDVLVPIVMCAYNKIRNCNKIIFDLRKNGGGSPGLVRFMQSFLFDKKTLLNELYWRIKGTDTYEIEKFYTYTKKELEEFTKMNNLSLFIDKQIFVLVSPNTFSAAEEFAYNLQNRKRAIIVGETTAGGANPGHVTNIDTKTRIFIPSGRAYNPISKTNWDGSGVIPDIQIDSCLPIEEIIKKI